MKVGGNGLKRPIPFCCVAAPFQRNAGGLSLGCRTSEVLSKGRLSPRGTKSIKHCAAGPSCPVKSGVCCKLFYSSASCAGWAYVCAGLVRDLALRDALCLCKPEPRCFLLARSILMPAVKCHMAQKPMPPVFVGRWFRSCRASCRSPPRHRSCRCQLHRTPRFIK